MKRLLPLIFATVATFAAQEPPYTIPGKIYESTPQVITPNAGPKVDHGIDVCITADFIYWTARMDGLSYAITGSSDGTLNASKGSVQYPDWRWKPGFKVGLGLNLPHDGWDIYAEYTWLHSRAWDATSINHKGILPTWDISHLDQFSTTTASITSARANWKVHINTFDLSLGRNYFISKFLTLRPFVGFKGSWIKQDYHVRYSVLINPLNSTLRMKNDQSYWGIGLRTGMNTAWHLTQAWSLYGDFALSALWSQFEVDRKDTRLDEANNGGANNPSLNTSITVVNSSNDFHTLKGVLELGLGVRGEWWVFEDRYHFLVQAGWEEQLWINHNNLMKLHFTQSDHGDLTLQGLTIKARFDF
ncbi:MAG: MOMP family protein [Simkaniaceae bacterium]|nr:MAG: MOMP family protein [Simkaniaceae bacterium]